MELKAFFGKFNQLVPRIIRNASILTLFVTVVSCSIYPNITDMARKIYPLFFMASLIVAYNNNKKRQNVMGKRIQ